MAKAEATVSVRIELANYQELLRTYHALGDILMAMSPEPARGHALDDDCKRCEVGSEA